MRRQRSIDRNDLLYDELGLRWNHRFVLLDDRIDVDDQHCNRQQLERSELLRPAGLLELRSDHGSRVFEPLHGCAMRAVR